MAAGDNEQRARERRLDDRPRELEHGRFQSVIDDMYGRFVALIVRSRKIPDERVRAFADGRIYTAEQAKALGLVDEIGYMDAVVAAARKAAEAEFGALHYDRRDLQRPMERCAALIERALDRRAGTPILKVTSAQPINEPFLDVLIEVS